MSKAMLAVLLAVVVTGCGSSGSIDDPVGPGEGRGDFRYYSMPDGRTVLCARLGGGASCDWGNAR